MNNNSKKFNNENSPFLDVTRFYTTKNGHFRSVEIDAAAFDALQKIQIGSRLFVELVPAEKRKGEKTPHARLKLIVEEAGANAGAARSGGARRVARAATNSSSDI